MVRKGVAITGRTGLARSLPTWKTCFDHYILICPLKTKSGRRSVARSNTMPCLSKFVSAWLTYSEVPTNLPRLSRTVPLQ